MGGFGSGNRTIRLTAMATVEESLKLTPGMLPQSVWFGAEATFLVRYAIGPPLRIVVQPTDRTTVTELALFFRRGELRWRQDVAVVRPSRGRRWFRCPVPLGERLCGRRVGTLYIPPGLGKFGCRACHRLTYESRQRTRPAGRQVPQSLFGGNRELAFLAKQLGLDTDVASFNSAVESILDEYRAADRLVGEQLGDKGKG